MGRKRYEVPLKRDIGQIKGEKTVNLQKNDRQPVSTHNTGADRLRSVQVSSLSILHKLDVSRRKVALIKCSINGRAAIAGLPGNSVGEPFNSCPVPDFDYRLTLVHLPNGQFNKPTCSGKICVHEKRSFPPLGLSGWF